MAPPETSAFDWRRVFDSPRPACVKVQLGRAEGNDISSEDRPSKQARELRRQRIKEALEQLAESKQDVEFAFAAQAEAVLGVDKSGSDIRRIVDTRPQL